MMNFLLRFRIFVLLFGFAAMLSTRADDELAAANSSYTNGNYEASARLFQQLIDQRGFSASLCFDLANAEERAGHTGVALLNYERARYLAPGDRDIDHNLQLARKQAGLDPNSYRWWQVALRSIDWTVWLTLMGVGLVLIFIAIVSFGYISSIAVALKLSPGLVRNIFRAILFAGIPICLILGYIELVTIGYNDRIEGVIVASKEATLRLSPFDSADSVGTIPEGELVTVEDRHNDYLRIEARDHHFGWIRQKDIEPIVAGSFDEKSSD
jgi:tetratricopeptide (TPR) repeat protein